MQKNGRMVSSRRQLLKLKHRHFSVYRRIGTVVRRHTTLGGLRKRFYVSNRIVEAPQSEFLGDICRPNDLIQLL
jgi:hypothetical protein